MRFKSDDGRQLAILIADDQADAAESLGWLLRLYGHEVTFARTGIEALEAATRTRPDVLIVEPLLPEIDGWELARRTGELPSGPVCIAVSARRQAEDRRRSLAAGMVLHLLKPADPDLLLAALAAISLRRHQPA
jgi:CheY-like chemotaxis protein